MGVNGSATCSQFSAIYPVILVPSVFFIDSSTGVDLEITGGVLNKDLLVESICKTLSKLNAGTPASPEANATPVTLATESAEVPIAHLVSEPSTSAAVSADTSGKESSSLEERVEKAKRLALQRQSEREQAEKDKEKSEELERRKIGKDMADLKSRQEEQQLKEDAMNRKKDKEEEKKAREAVKAAIEQDRLARKMKYDAEKKEVDEKKKEIERKNLAAAAAAAEISAAARASVSRLQFRLPDGRAQTKQFPADTSLAEVYTFVEAEVLEPTFGKFTLTTTFPRRQLDQEDQTRSLKELQMAPSATILVLPIGGLVTRGGGGDLMSLLWLLLTPFTALWAMLNGFFSSTSSSTVAPVSRDTRGGNIGRVRRDEDNDDENNTWNGNSTQQM